MRIHIESPTHPTVCSYTKGVKCQSKRQLANLGFNTFLIADRQKPQPNTMDEMCESLGFDTPRKRKTSLPDSPSRTLNVNISRKEPPAPSRIPDTWPRLAMISQQKNEIPPPAPGGQHHHVTDISPSELPPSNSPASSPGLQAVTSTNFHNIADLVGGRAHDAHVRHHPREEQGGKEYVHGLPPGSLEHPLDMSRRAATEEPTSDSRHETGRGTNNSMSMSHICPHALGMFSPTSTLAFFYFPGTKES